MNARLPLALATPALILLALLGALQRQGVERWQALPAVLIGIGLLVAGARGYARRRRQLGAKEGRRWGAGSYAVPFICAISDTSPTSKLNVTFLQTCTIEPQYARRSREQPTAAYNCRSVRICVMLVGSVPVRRFSPNSLPGRHQ